LSVSARSWNGSRYFSWNAFCAATSSVETPKTLTRFSVSVEKASRRLHACLVQPGVSALG
jgi:hypothetical protein